MAKAKGNEEVTEVQEENTETPKNTKGKVADVKFLCPDCKFFINEKCEHYSNIKILIKKRVEKKVYISLNQKTECDYVQPKA